MKPRTIRIRFRNLINDLKELTLIEWLFLSVGVLWIVLCVTIMLAVVKAATSYLVFGTL